MFASGQLSGRSGRECVKAIGEHAYAEGEQLTPLLRKAFIRFLCRLEEGAPRVICNASRQMWFVYTDASYEPKAEVPHCGIGGLLCNSDGNPPQFFPNSLDRDARVFLGEGVSKQIILEAEMLALLVSLMLWKDIVRGAPIVFFINNNSARDITISGSARSKMPSQLLEVFLSYEDQASIFSWIARVPSPSNPADLPSSLRLKSCFCLGGVVFRFGLPTAET